MKEDSQKNLKIWTTLDAKVVHKNPWFSVVHEKFITPKGTVGNYYVLQTKGEGAALIVPVKDGKIIMIKQYRYVAKRYFLEVPGGAVENGCSIRETAVKELREELGYKGKLKKIGQYRPWSPLRENCGVFLATDLVFVGQDLDETEKIVVEEIKIADAYRMLDNGRFKDSQTITALSFARKYLLKT